MHNRAGFRSLSRAMFLGFVRDRSALFFSVLFPVIFLVFFGSIFKSSGVPKPKILEVGQVSLLAQASSSGGLNHVLTITKTSDLGTALSDVRKGTYAAAVQQQGSTLVVHYSAADQVTAGVVNTIFSSIVQQANQAASGQPPQFHLTSQQVEDKSLKGIQYVTPGLLGWAIASAGAFGAAITLVTWRQNKLLRRLRLAPIRIGTVVTARIGVSLAVALIQMAVFLAIATIPYFGLKLSKDWWMSIPLVACGTLAFMAIGMFVGSFAKTQQSATTLANLIILPMAFLGGAFIPLDLAPAWIRDASYVMPLRYLVNGMLNVMARGQPAASALPAIGILLAFTAVLTAISVRTFKWDAI
ncbi:MAG: ABC transporter permease [Micromonosporaceae bacterium]